MTEINKDNLSKSKTYKFKHTPTLLRYTGMFQGWHSFTRIEAPNKVWAEVLEHELNLLEEVED